KDAVFLSETREERVEFLPVVGSEISRREHAGEEDGKLALLELGEDLVEGLLGFLWIDAPQRVVGAKLDDDAVNLSRERPVEPLGAGAAGIARHPGIGYHDIVTLGLERR